MATSRNELQRDIIATAQRLGWRVAHFTAVKTEHGWRTPVAAQGKGFPDLVLVRERVVVIEVKLGGHKPTGEQAEWLTAFRLAGVEAFVATRKSWADGTIVEVLTRRARTPQLDFGAESQSPVSGVSGAA